MKIARITLFFGVLFALSACANTETTVLPTVATANKPFPTHTPSFTVSVTPSQTPKPTSTPTLLPSATQTKKGDFTSTNTAPPTITSTFDIAKVITRTPSPPEQCPEENPELQPDVEVLSGGSPYLRIMKEPMLEFLNAGGMPQAIISEFLQEYQWFEEGMGVEEDITGDGVPEFIITDNYAVSVFGCRNGKYEELFSYMEEPGRLRWIRFTASEDMNVNGIPELIINAQSGHTTAEHSIGVYEWNGERIESIIRGESYADGKYWDVVFMTGATSVKVQDVDGNGTKELILTGGIPYKPSPAYEFGLPWRDETNIYEWNGQQFVLADVEYSPPEYRFQAVQDGDRLTMKGEYDQAIDAYQEAIFSDQLEWWSAERWSYEIQKLWAEQGSVLPTPVPDSEEYWNLAAYARFRLLLIHVLRGETAEAEIIYNTLRKKFQPEQPGYIFVEIADILWEEYQASQDMGEACRKVIEYVKLHPEEVLSYLGNGEYARTYYGEQSLEYTPEDICPFP